MVVAKLPDVLGELIAWGRDGAGWWGLVVWSGRMMRPDSLVLGGDVRFSAWMPASTLRRSDNPMFAEPYRDVVKLDLPDDQAVWPSPSDRHDIDCEHLGIISAPMKQGERGHKLTT